MSNFLLRTSESRYLEYSGLFVCIRVDASSDWTDLFLVSLYCRKTPGPFQSSDISGLYVCGKMIGNITMMETCDMKKY